MINLKGLIILFSFILLSFEVFCANFLREEEEHKLNLDSRRRLRKYLAEEFEPAVHRHMNNCCVYTLYDVVGEIDIYFIDGKFITKESYNEIMVYWDTVLESEKITDFPGSEELVQMLAGICNKCIQEDKAAWNQLNLKTMADVCHLFKKPVQWLVLTSSAYGHPEMFHAIPIILESIRKKIFLKDLTYSTMEVDFEDKLDFILKSFDFNISQYTATSTEALNIHQKLSKEFMAMVKAIRDDLKQVMNPFSTLHTGLGQEEIDFNITTEGFCSSNEELWQYIIAKIEDIRKDLIADFSPSVLQELSLIDLIVARINGLISLNDLFTLEKAHYIIQSSFQDFIASIKCPDQSGCESSNEQKTFCVDIEKLHQIFVEAFAQFNSELVGKIEEVYAVFSINSTDSISLDLGTIAVSKMAKAHFALQSDSTK